MDKPAKKLIVVLGMHRSGTSAITRALSVMGVELGDRLMPAAEGNNEKGFWEDMDINSLNDDMLHAIGNGWAHLTPIETKDLDCLRENGFFLKAAQLLRQKTADTNIFGIKDPRLSRLLPFWREVFNHCGIQPHYLLALRNPLSVVKSLQKRDDLAPEQSYFLWVEHLLTCLPTIVEHNGLIVDYDQLMESASAEIHRIANHFALPIVDAELQIYEQEFLDKNLRHSTYEQKDLLVDPACPQLARDIYRELQQYATTADSDIQTLAKKTTTWERELSLFNPLLTLSDKTWKKLEQTTHELNERTAEFYRVNHIANLRDQTIHDLNQLINSLRSDIERQNRTLLDQIDTIRHQTQSINALTETCDQRLAHIEQLSAAVAEQEQQISDKNQHIANLDAIIQEQAHHQAQLAHAIAALHQSTSWKITAPMRVIGYQLKRIKRILRLLPTAIKTHGGIVPLMRRVGSVLKADGLQGFKRGLLTTQRLMEPQSATPGQQETHQSYSEWIKSYDTVTPEIRQALQQHLGTFKNTPLISVVMPTYNPNPDWLAEAIESVRNQIYPHWELCIADDVSTDERIFPLLQEYAQKDKRIKVMRRETNGHISAATNSALTLVTGEWVALMDHDDLLPEHALFWVAETINHHPDAQMIYSDEDKIDENYVRFEPYFKSDWNPELFCSHNMFSHLGVYRTALIESVGGFREGYEGSQDYDLALRCIEQIQPQQIHHIPRVLYHWRVHAESTASSADAKPYAMLAGLRALNDHYQRTNTPATAEALTSGYRTRYKLPDNQPLVSLIIPTRNGLDLLRQCIESISDKTTYPNYEIIVVDNGSDDPAALTYLAELDTRDNMRVMRDDRPFNYSALNNAAVKIAKGELIGLINNDIEVIEPDWLSEMVSHAVRDGVGAVGAKLLYPNDHVQHAGVMLGGGDGVRGIAGHVHLNIHRDAHGYFSRAQLTQSYSAVTAACLIIKKTIFDEVGGLNETDLAVAFNDVDFCLRVREAGYRNVWTPFALLYHHESATRGYEDTPEKKSRFAKEIAYMHRRWDHLLYCDPAYNPNLDLHHADFSLAWPPRIALLPESNAATP